MGAAGRGEQPYFNHRRRAGERRRMHPYLVAFVIIALIVMNIVAWWGWRERAAAIKELEEKIQNLRDELTG